MCQFNNILSECHVANRKRSGGGLKAEQIWPKRNAVRLLVSAHDEFDTFLTLFVSMATEKKLK